MARLIAGPDFAYVGAKILLMLYAVLAVAWLFSWLVLQPTCGEAESSEGQDDSAGQA